MGGDSLGLSPNCQHAEADLHEVLLGLLNASNISKGDASVGLHLELGFALAKVEGVVASRASHATSLSPGQEEEATHQQ